MKILDLLIKRQKEYNAKGFFGNMTPGTGRHKGRKSSDSDDSENSSKGNVPYGSSGNAKSTIPLQMMDESGRTVDFAPVTLWAGADTKAIGWDVEDLETERLLLTRDSIMDEIDDWINLHKIKDYPVAPEVIDVEVKIEKLFTPPLPWFLSECMFEFITESKLSKDLKYKRHRLFRHRDKNRLDYQNRL